MEGRDFKEHEVVHVKATIIHCYNNSKKVYVIELIDALGKSHIIDLSKDQMSEIIKAENGSEKSE